MSSLPADIIIWALLVIGIVFAGIGLMGLLIFPDTRSRMFTAFRATAIGLGAVALAVITYGFTLLTITGSDQYPALILHMLVLVFVLAAGTRVMYGIIRERTNPEKTGNNNLSPAGPETSKKVGE
jgi:multisubunit Na+/H+ antiporter MnhG subunit